MAAFSLDSVAVESNHLLFYPREVVCQHSWNDETVSNALDGFCYLNDLSIQPNAYGGHVGL